MATATADFLAQRRIAVAGVSRDASTHGGNAIYRRFKARGYTVFAVNPNAETVEGDRAYADLASIPGGVDGVVICTAPAHAEGIVRECEDLGITRVWMHRGPAETSASNEAIACAQRAGMSVIPGGCLLMFGPTADLPHRCMRWFLQRGGIVPTGI